MYESEDFIKSAKIEYEQTENSYLFYVCDESKYIKVFSIQEENNGNKQLVLENDYYVKHNFKGENTNYIITNKILYCKFQAFLLQERECASEDYGLFFEPEDLGIDPSKIDDVYPIESKTWLLYFGIRENATLNRSEQEAFLLPQFNHPKILILDPNEMNSYRSEFFFYHNQNYLVYMKWVEGLDHLIYEIYNLNGSLVQTLELRIKGMKDCRDVNIIMSPSGQYIFFVEDSDSLIDGRMQK